MLVAIYHCFALLRPHYNRNDLRIEAPRRWSCCCALLTTQAEGILVLARDVILHCNVICGLRHGVHAILALHVRVDEAPTQRRVVDCWRALKGHCGLPHYKG